MYYLRSAVERAVAILKIMTAMRQTVTDVAKQLEVKQPEGDNATTFNGTPLNGSVMRVSWVVTWVKVGHSAIRRMTVSLGPFPMRVAVCERHAGCEWVVDAMPAILP